MAGYSIDEHCLVCNSILTSGGQCPSCDAFTIEKNSVVTDLDSHRNKAIKAKPEFKSADGGKHSYCSAFLFNKKTKERFQLAGAVNKIGRDHSNDISLPEDHYVSRNHAWVLKNKGKFWVEDVGSQNGTLLNGQPITERMQLSAGDRLTFGKTELILVVE